MSRVSLYEEPRHRGRKQQFPKSVQVVPITKPQAEWRSPPSAIKLGIALLLHGVWVPMTNVHFMYYEVGPIQREGVWGQQYSPTPSITLQIVLAVG